MKTNEQVTGVTNNTFRQAEAASRCGLGSDAEYLTLKSVAQLTSFSYDFIYDAVRNGSLPSVKKGREWRVAVADMRSWMDKDRAGHLKPTRSAMESKISQLLPRLSR